MTTILALDLGTQTGWALHDGCTIRSGSESFHAKKKERSGTRWMKFRRFLIDTRYASTTNAIDAVYYEDVRRHIGTTAAHVYGGFLATLEAWCEVNNVPLFPVGVGQIKKHATGKGNTKKQGMIDAAKNRGFEIIDDNHADALALLSYAIVNHPA